MPQNYDNVPLTFNGNNSMLSSVTGAFPSYHNRTIPMNQIPNQSYMQPTNNQQSSGAGRFLGLLGSPTTTNTQGK